MNLAEKLKLGRKKLGLTQQEMAKKAKMNLITYLSYENGNSYPRRERVYDNLAAALQVDKAELCTQFELFMMEVGNTYGQRGQQQALADLGAGGNRMLAGGSVSETNAVAVQMELEDIFMEAKAMSRQKYAPRKYLAKAGDK